SCQRIKSAMETWQLIVAPKLSGSANMQFDLKLLNDLEKGLVSSTLRIYSWKPKCISLGYAQKMDRLIDAKMARVQGWDIVKRPTGGGIVFHNEAEVTYALVTAIDNPVLPKGLVSSYKRISEAIVFALNKIGIVAQIRNPKHETRNKSQLCFSYPAEYEIVVDRKKIVGSAQKRGKRALLQQGSIFVSNIDNSAYSVLKNSYEKQNAVSIEAVLGRKVSFEELSKALIKGFEERLGVKFKT
ncbi:MAG: lipoate--protein ligase family protein, partial [Candidatus Margulisiibacteriota bacterium]